MKVSYNWLKKYVELPEDFEKLAHDLTIFGLNVEEIIIKEPDFSGVVLGRVTRVRKHPNADRLSLCEVDVGDDSGLQIVCGAPNVRKGLKVPVALDGAELPGGFKIKKTKLRGEKSEGMICSEKELGISERAEGIMELSLDYQTGRDLEDVLGNSDTIFDIEVTPNRPDQLSHIGIAREIAALYQQELRYPELFPLDQKSDFEIKLEDVDGCPRYSAALVEEINVAPSPLWMQKLLRAVGVKPINNIVDITNFVMMEYGHPLHAFDRDKLKGDTIRVRRAEDGEEIITLDGVTRELNSETLVIADQQSAVGLAGIMGGLVSEVSPDTRNVLIESAMFDPGIVRKSKEVLKLETEASYRFEREGDIGVTVTALRRVCQLIDKTGAGKPLHQFKDVMAKKEWTEYRRVSLNVEQANRLMGTHLNARDIVDLLERLELESDSSDNQVNVSVPSFRRDIHREVDLIEEIARTYGYDNLRDGGEQEERVYAVVSAEDEFRENIRDFMVARGYAEAITSSFMNPSDILNFQWSENDPRFESIELANPLTEKQSLLRTSLIPGLLRVITNNPVTEQEGIRIFEMGKTFRRRGKNGGLPIEDLHLTAVFTRKSKPLQWLEDEEEFDYFDMKGELEALLLEFGIDVEMERVGQREISDIMFEWIIGNDTVAECGMLPREVLSGYDIKNPVYFYDINFSIIQGHLSSEIKQSGVSPYPAVKRDLCLVSSNKFCYRDIKDLIVQTARNLESIELFDYYRDGHLGKGKRSYTFRLYFRSPEKTLDDSRVDKEIYNILSRLKEEYGIVLREK